MCMKNYQPVSEYNSPCGTCPEYLNSCMPVIVEGYIFGECDLSYCEFCSYYAECMPRIDTAYQSEYQSEDKEIEDEAIKL